MKNCSLIVFFIGFNSIMFGQNTTLDTTFVDDKYREDQFYISITYNLLEKKPEGVSQNGFSSGFHFGFIRDMPINKQRNIAFGLGLGISTNSYNQNVLITENAGQSYNYTILDKNTTDFTKNKFSTYVFELPLEFRWRTSNATEYNFWRVYTGFKLGYMFYNSTKFKSSEGNVQLSNISDFNKFQFGFTTSVGYSNINVHFYYAFNEMFKNEAKIDGQNISMNTIKIGLIYYIL